MRHRSMQPDAGVAIASTLALAAFGVAPAGARGWTLAAALVPLAASLVRSRPLVTGWALVATAFIGLRTLAPTYAVWPVHFAAPLLLVAGYSWTGRGPAPASSWATGGSFELGIKILTLIVAGLSALGFVAWAVMAGPQVNLPSALRGQPVPILIVAGCGFAIVNAGMEELVFRGVALRALSSVCRTRTCAILLQAVAFGALHYASPSMPYGLAGVGMTFIYGVALGVLADRAEGIFAAWVAHVVADLLVFVVLVGWL